MSDEMDALPLRKAHTINVLVLLLVAAAVFSYLGAYAATNALVAANLLNPWPDGEDPRPRWMLDGFISLLTLFGAAAALLKWSSGRQLRRMDAMEEDEPINADYL
jgi:hypothetical protein